MRNKVIILISIIIIISGIIAMILGFGSRDISGNVYISDSVSNNDVLENVVLVHVIDYNYLGDVSNIEHDWLMHSEPDYMLDVIEACAAVVDSYFDSNVPTVYHYSNSYKYAYLTSESSVCLLTPEDSSMNELIIEVGLDKVYLYEIR
jgi:hypothetical protein